jgi:predicted HicB family RNase H-like nuclease
MKKKAKAKAGDILLDAEPKTDRLTLRLDRETHRRLKIASAQTGVLMRDLCIRAVNEFLDRHGR